MLVCSVGEDVRKGSRARCPDFGGAVVRVSRCVFQQEAALLCPKSEDEPARSQVSQTHGTTPPSYQPTTAKQYLKKKKWTGKCGFIYHL